MKVTVYHKYHCAQCLITMRQLEANGIPFEAINIDDHPEYKQQLKDEGFGSTPVVKLDNGKSWSGFQINEVRALIANKAQFA